MMQISDKKYLKQLDDQINRIIESRANKKLIVAGPGTGKTYSFREILSAKEYPRDRCLVFTFLGALKEDLERDLESFALVFTFHGYCYYLLRKYAELREGLEDGFEYFPLLESIIKKDWEIILKKKQLNFIKDFQLIKRSNATSFFLKRGNYYNATGFDDSVFRVYSAFKKKPQIDISYKIILIDEVQDLNRLEANFVHLLSNFGPIIIAGDDDQSIYELLRNATPKYIRWLYKNPDFENHEFSYCLRCTHVIVEAAKEVIRAAINKSIFKKDRIPKNFEYFPPFKKEDSQKYRLIESVCTSIQTNSANYIARYILNKISEIPQGEIDESHLGGFPTALIISSNPIRRQIENHFKEKKVFFFKRESRSGLEISREQILCKIRENPKSNLWWRVILEKEKPLFSNKVISESQKGELFYKLLPKEFVDKILEEAKSSVFEEATKESTIIEDKTIPTIKITTFEGAKGLSAQHVFIASLQSGDLPRNPKRIKVIEVRKFLVALTRARKCCYLLFSKNFGNIKKDPSDFLEWIKDNRKNPVFVDKKYFEELEKG